MSDLLQIDEETSAFSSSPIYYEWTDGVAYAMSNTPSSYHQIIQDELTQQLKLYFNGKRCRVYPAPFTVSLTEFVRSKKKTEYIPDISVVCDPSKLNAKKNVYHGAPSLVVEVGSPATLDKDLHEKRINYELSGIVEYLVVTDPTAVYRFTLKNGQYERTLYEADESGNLTIPIDSFEGLQLEIRDDWFWFERGNLKEPV